MSRRNEHDDLHTTRKTLCSAGQELSGFHGLGKIRATVEKSPSEAALGTLRGLCVLGVFTESRFRGLQCCVFRMFSESVTISRDLL